MYVTPKNSSVCKFLEGRLKPAHTTPTPHPSSGCYGSEYDFSIRLKTLLEKFDVNVPSQSEEYIVDNVRLDILAKVE